MQISLLESKLDAILVSRYQVILMTLAVSVPPFTNAQSRHICSQPKGNYANSPACNELSG